MLFNFFHFLNLKKTASVFLLAIIFINMAFMFALLPIQTQQAKAQVIPVPLPTIPVTESPLSVAWQGLKAGWQAVNSAIDKVTSIFSGVTAAFSAWEKSRTIIGDLLTAALTVLLHQILQMITNEIIKWINGGGAPKFVSDWGGFLRDAANQAGGEFLNTLTGGFLCSPFAFQIRLALMPVSYYKQASCTLDKIQANFQAFAENFTAGGGWPMWLQVIQPNNNFYGSYLMALDEKDKWSYAAAEKAKNEAMSGGGFLGDKKCMSCTIGGESGSSSTYNDMKECEGWKKAIQTGSPMAFKCNREQIMTPATIAQYEVQQAVDSTRKIIQDSISNLAGKSFITPYIVAIANALINRVIQTGLSYVAQAIAGGDQSYGPTFSNPNAPIISSEPMVQQFIDTEGIASVGDTVSSSPNLITIEELLKENEQNKLIEQQESLGILTSIQDKQTQTLQGLKTLIEKNCSLPLWATAQTISDNGATQIIKIIATDIGSITIKKTTTTNSLGTSTTFETQETLPAVATQKTTLESATNATQQTINDIDTSIADNRTAMAAADEYIALSENSYGPLGATSAEIAEAKAALEASYDKAIASSQKAIGTNETDLALILADAQQKNIDVITEATQIEQARETLNTQLSNISSKPTETQNLITNCSTTP